MGYACCLKKGGIVIFNPLKRIVGPSWWVLDVKGMDMYKYNTP